MVSYHNGFLTYSFVLSTISLLFLKLAQTVYRRMSRPYPPGPTPLPLIGNLLEFPISQPWLTYTKWGKKYGDVVYARVFGQHIIILNSHNAVQDLFEKKANIYSDRPVLPMRDILGWDFVVGLMHYASTWRLSRRTLWQRYRPDAALAYRPLQMQKIRELLRNLLLDPENFKHHYEYMAASIIMSTVYGYPSAPTSDPFISNAEKAITLMTNSMFPGASIANSLQFLRYMPSWVPGSQFQKQAEECRKLTREMLDLPFEFVKQSLEKGTDEGSLVKELIDEGKIDEEMIKGLGATAYSAGADTVACTIGAFFHICSTHPQAVLKAYKEIQSVVGPHRLPTFSDRSSLPYVEAFYRELMRWRPAMPMGVAHSCLPEGNEKGCRYRGWWIPKGATIMSNVWAMTRDEAKYPNAEEFLPERFINQDGALNDDSTILTFGFGRRICIGRHAADASLWGTIVSILATFEFGPAFDIETGERIGKEGRFTDALISHAVPFKCEIKARTEEAKKLIEETFDDNAKAAEGVEDF